MPKRKSPKPKIASSKSWCPPKRLSSRLKQAESILRQDEQLVGTVATIFRRKTAAKKKELEAALAEREKAVAPIPDDLRVLYDRIAKRHNGTALAHVQDDQCKGCGLRVLPHTLQLLTQDHDDEEVYRCESCGLILYSLEPLTAINPDS